KGQLRQRIFAAKVHVRKMGQAGQILAPGSPAKCACLCARQFPLIGWLQVTVEDARRNDLALAVWFFLFGSNGKVRKTIDAALVGTVEDFPIDQPPISSEANAAGTNAAQRKTNLACLGPTIEKIVTRIHFGFLLSPLLSPARQ